MTHTNFLLIISLSKPNEPLLESGSKRAEAKAKAILEEASEKPDWWSKLTCIVMVAIVAGVVRRRARIVIIASRKRCLQLGQRHLYVDDLDLLALRRRMRLLLVGVVVGSLVSGVAGHLLVGLRVFGVGRERR